MERLMIHMWNITWKVVFGHFAVIWRSFGLHFESCGLRRDSSIFNQFQKSSKSKNYFDFWNPNFGFLTARYHYKQIRPLCLTIINHDEPLLNHISLCERKNSKTLVSNHLNITLDSIHTWTSYSNIFKWIHGGIQRCYSRVSIVKEHWFQKMNVEKMTSFWPPTFAVHPFRTVHFRVYL